jgi:hypothetical protein
VPNPVTFYLRLRPAEQRCWVRRHLFMLGYSPCWRIEEATSFPSRAAALAFAQEFKLVGAADLVTVSAEEIRAA